MSRRWALLTFILAVLITAIGQIPESAASSSDVAKQEQKIHSAIELLSKVPTGRVLLVKALKAWKLDSTYDLIQVLRPGETSRTDAVLTRHFSPSTGTETREREVTVYVKTGQSLENMVLDIAHEMVHATSRPVLDPYDPELTAGKYIKNAIEGEGGEIAAVESECQIGLELSKKIPLNLKRCSNYFSDSREIDPARIKSDFYRVGKWENQVSKTLGGEMDLFPQMSSESPRLYSSTGNAPYPAALIQEFRSLTQIACENSKRRLDSVSGRSLASADSNQMERTSEFLERRCQ